MHELYAAIDVLPAEQNDSLIEIIGGGLNYHGWYVPLVATPQRYQIVVGSQTLLHPYYTRGDTSFIESNMIFCKAPNAPASISQPGDLPEGAEWKPHFYYVRGEDTQFPNGFEFINSAGQEDWFTIRPNTNWSYNGFFYHPHYGRLFRVMAGHTSAKSNYVDLVILDCLPHEVAEDGIVLLVENFFGAANSGINADLMAICPGTGDKTAWQVGVSTSSAKVYELRLTWEAGAITPELVELPINDLVTGFVGGKDGTPSASGSVQDKSAKLTETGSSNATCDSGLSKTLKTYAADWTTPVNIDATVTREYDRIVRNGPYYSLIYVDGELWYLHNRYRFNVTKNTGITYNASGTISQSLNAAACTVNTTGTATWTKITTVTWEVEQENDFMARTFDGDVMLCHAVRTYSGTYKYTVKSKAENTTTVSADPTFTATNDHQDQTSIAVTGLLGAFNLSGGTATYVGNDPNTSADLYGSPLGASNTSSQLSFETPEPITNFDFHHSHLAELGQFKLKNRVMTEQGLDRTTVVVPNTPDAHSMYGYILSSGTPTGLAHGYTTSWQNAYVDGHEGNYDYYPFWADDLQEIQHRYAGSFSPTDTSNPDLPNSVLAIWL